MKIREVVIVGVLLASVISGCIDASDSESEEESIEPYSISGNRISMYLLEETVDGEVWYQLHQKMEDCVLRIDRDGPYNYAPPRMVFMQYDRYDLQQETTKIIDPDQSTLHFNVTLIGEPPYLVFSNGYYCADNPGKFNGIHNVVQGERLTSIYDDGGIDSIQQLGNITVAPLETMGYDSWTPPKTFYQFIGITFRYDFEGYPWGTARMFDPDGELRAWDEFTLWGDDAGGNMMSRGPPGTYDLELELTEPAYIETTWTYSLGFKVMNEDFCKYGFEWPFLCT